MALLIGPGEWIASELAVGEQEILALLWAETMNNAISALAGAESLPTPRTTKPSGRLEREAGSS